MFEAIKIEFPSLLKREKIVNFVAGMKSTVTTQFFQNETLNYVVWPVINSGCFITFPN